MLNDVLDLCVLLFASASLQRLNYVWYNSNRMDSGKFESASRVSDFWLVLGLITRLMLRI